MLNQFARSALLLCALSFGSPAGLAAEPVAIPEKAPEFVRDRSQAPTPGQALLNQALNNMNRLKSLRFEAELKIGTAKIPLQGQMGIGSVDLLVRRADGLLVRHLIVGDQSLISSDRGQTWQPDKEDAGLLLSQLLTSPFNPTLKLAEQGEVKVLGEESLQGVSTTHLQLVAKSPIELWIQQVEGIGPLLYRYKGVIEADDGSFDVTIDYREFNQPVEIKLPEAAAD